MSNVEYDVAIIGAGISGLTAAHSLLKKDPDLKLLIIEKGNVSGGQICSSPEGELGGRWFSEGHHELINLCKELKICVGKYQSMPKYLLDVWEIDKGYLSCLARFELKRFFKRIDLLSKECNCNASSSETTMSMEKYICRNLLFNSSRNIVRFMIRSICGLYAENVTFSEFLCICQGTNGLTNQFKWLTKPSDQVKIEPNFTALITALENQIGKKQFLFNTRVIEINQDDHSAILLTDKGNKIRTLIVIPAISWLDIKQINFYPDHICCARKQFTCSENYVTSFIAEYDTSHWRLNGFSGFMLSHDPHFICYESKRNTLAGLVYHDKEYSVNIEEEAMQKFCLQFGHGAGIPVKWTQKTWQQSPAQGNYLSKVNKTIIWASADASFYYRGFLNGAVVAGQRSAVFALLTIRPQLIQWKDIGVVQPAAVVRPSVALCDKILASINLYDILTIAVTIPIGIGVCYLVLKRRCL